MLKKMRVRPVSTLPLIAKIECMLKWMLFCAIAGAAWYFVNGGVVYAEEGFDPFRYEYMARNGLPPALEGASSYLMVYLLQIVYLYLPYYFGYIFFLMILGLPVVWHSRWNSVRVLMFSPIFAYYFSQTGKDGLAMLAISAVIIAMDKGRSFFSYFVALGLCALALFVRPALVLVFPVLVVHYFYGLKKATVFSFLVMVLFFGFYNEFEALSVLENIAADEGSGAAAKMLRSMSFGYEFMPSAVRLLLFFVSPIIQPMVGLVKIINGADGFIFFETFSFTVFFLYMVRRKIVKSFMVASIPYVFVVGFASPFYHFRYIAVVYPAICFLVLCKERCGIFPQK